MEPVRDIVVMGEGSASGTPDRCLISLALNVAADTPAEALSGVGHVADRVLDALAGDGVPPSDVQTVGLSVRDVHDREKNRVTARVASYALTVGLPGLAGAGALLVIGVGGLWRQLSASKARAVPAGEEAGGS